MLLAKQLWTFRPSKVDLIFACKTFFAGMVALYIAFLLDLPYPMWAIGTVFIIANPYAGMVSSKAIYRLAGTFFGAVIALIMLPHLINTPLIFTIVLAAWVGICLYISMLDRTPRSYMFMLAGYTCVMVATNVIHTLDNAPLTYSMFDIALGRVLEISIAVIVTSVVFSTIFPLHIGTAIQQRVQKTLTDTTDVFIQLFQDHPQEKTATQLIAVINRDTNDLHGLAVHLSYEKGKLHGMTKPLQEMLHQFSLVLVNLVAMSQRLQQLDQLNIEIRRQLQPVMTNIVLFLKQPIDLTHQEKQILPTDFDMEFDKLILNTKSSDAKVVIESLKMDIRHFVQNAYYVKYIWALMQSGERKIPEFIQPITTSYPSLHRDHGVALRGALAAVVSILVAFTIWIYSGWEYGFMMAQMAAIISCILTALDNPIPTLKVFLRGTVYATIIVFIYLFFILPDVKAFWQLAVVLAPVMIYAVCLIPHPPLTGLGLPVAINVIMALNLQNHYQISPIPSIDAAIAGLVGPIIPVLALYYIRAMSPDITAKRLVESHYQAMREAIHIPFGNQFNIHLRSMLDRIGLLNTKPVESQGIKELMNESLIETSAIADLSRLDELAHHIEMPIEIRQKLAKLQLLFAQEFQWQEKNFLNKPRHADDIFTCLDDLQDTSQIMQNEHLKQRLWMSLNNVRYSICHASTRAKQLQLEEVRMKGSVI